MGQSWVDKMVQRIKMLTAETEDLSVIPGTHMVRQSKTKQQPNKQDTDSQMLFSDLHIHMLKCTHIHPHPYTFVHT